MPKRPNFLFILSDDQGSWAMHCAGMPELCTPNLDRLAESGMMFENFFCVSPVCSPARASLLTGTIPSAHGIHDWLRSGNVDGERFAREGADNPYAGGYRDERQPIRYLEGKTAYTDLLAESGYSCALSGKWHLGDSLQPQHGFSRWYTTGKGGCFYCDPDMAENGSITVHHGRYVTELITEKALSYLEELTAEDAPFYLGVHYTAPHSPWYPEQHPAKWIQHYQDNPFASIPDLPDHPDSVAGPVHGTAARQMNLTGFCAAVSAMDEQIGRLLDALEASGQRDNTVVIFSADNGMSMGQHGIWGKGNGTFPFNMYDTAVKVPFLISWPGHIPAGKICGELVSAYDVFPTILSLAGLSEKAADEGNSSALRPGKDFSDLLLPAAASCCRGQEDASRAIVVYDEYGPVRMIRTKEWKYIHRYPYGPHELYHLTEDPGEERNLYDRPDMEPQILALRTRLENWFASYARPDTDGVLQGVTGNGQMGQCGICASQKDIYHA